MISLNSIKIEPMVTLWLFKSVSLNCETEKCLHDVYIQLSPVFNTFKFNNSAWLQQEVVWKAEKMFPCDKYMAFSAAVGGYEIKSDAFVKVALTS